MFCISAVTSVERLDFVKYILQMWKIWAISIMICVKCFIFSHVRYFLLKEWLAPDFLGFHNDFSLASKIQRCCLLQNFACSYFRISQATAKKLFLKTDLQNCSLSGFLIVIYKIYMTCIKFSHYHLLALRSGTSLLS